MYMYISEPLYIFKTLMSSFLRIFVLSPTPLKLVLHSYPEAPAIEKKKRIKEVTKSSASQPFLIPTFIA